MRIGVFGGTFNPIHIAHLRLAQDVLENYRFDKIIFIPTYNPPHKSIDVWIDPVHRLNMVKLAISDNPQFICEDVELQRGGISYTIDTVKFLYKKYRFSEKPGFLVGSDLIVDLGSWKNIYELAELVDFIVLWRNETNLLDEIAARSTGVEIEYRNNVPEVIKVGIRDKNGEELFITVDKIVYRRMDITGSEIRRLVKMGKNVRYLVTKEVFNYIENHRLYR